MSSLPKSESVESQTSSVEESEVASSSDEDDPPSKRPRVASTSVRHEDIDLTTANGQAAMNPGMSLDECKQAAKRESNRVNSARARDRHKKMLRSLHDRIDALNKREVELVRENDILRLRLEFMQQQKAAEHERAPPTALHIPPPVSQPFLAPPSQHRQPLGSESSISNTPSIQEILQRTIRLASLQQLASSATNSAHSGTVSTGAPSVGSLLRMLTEPTTVPSSVDVLHSLVQRSNAGSASSSLSGEEEARRLALLEQLLSTLRHPNL